MRRIETNGYSLEVGSIIESSFSNLLKQKYADSKKVILVDENTHANCLSYIITNFSELSEAEVIMLPAGEDSKQMELTYSVWEALTEYGITRFDLIINLGGGVITDMGGFIASCYKRGCDFINIPTSLLAMVDASIGGKTGINLGHFKNQLGVFSNPVALYIDPVFLSTLPGKEVLSGFGEMIKHGLIADAELYNAVRDEMLHGETLEEDILVRCIEVKNEVVKQDPKESGLRKILNFGHTVGHVIEGHFLPTLKLSHGHSIAIGMVMEAYISMKRVGLSVSDYEELATFILGQYQLPEFSDEDIKSMLSMLQNDKKNRADKILCCLIPALGECVYDQEVDEQMFLETFMHFKNLQVNLN